MTGAAIACSPPRMRRLTGALAVMLLLAGGTARAHVASSGFLTVHADRAALNGTFELAVRDLEVAVGVDGNGDGKVTWGELRAAEPVIRAYVATHLGLALGGKACPVGLGALQVNDRVDGAYAWLPITADCPTAAGDLDIRYSFLRGIDPSHRGLLTLAASQGIETHVLDPSAASARFPLTAPSVLRTVREYFRAGVLHIWSGIDHLLFLLSLLLPAVLVRTGREWRPVPRARPALVDIVKVVTAFTLAHSLTLTLAALDVVRLPTRLTESVIAASIVVAALNNVFPVVTESRARIAFAFGLLHGFGFASVLADMGLPAGARLTSLVAFNLGIEAGQLAVVVAIMPLIYVLRSAVIYRRGLMPWGSAAIAVLAFVWLIQRALLP